MKLFLMRNAYRRNRMWGDGVLEASWYAVRGKAFPAINFDERLDDDGNIVKKDSTLSADRDIVAETIKTIMRVRERLEEWTDAMGLWNDANHLATEVERFRAKDAKLRQDQIEKAWDTYATDIRSDDDDDKQEAMRQLENTLRELGEPL